MNKLLIAAVLTAVLIVPANVAAAPLGSFREPRSIAEDIWRDVDAQSDSNQSIDDDTGDTISTRTGRALGNLRIPTANASADKPGELLDLTNWYLTLPTGSKGKPDTIKQSELAGYSSQYMQVNEGGDGVVFTANAGGATTKNSKYPRSELREMNGNKNASWDGTTGSHTMEIRQAVTLLPAQKAEVVVGQIHATSDDLMQIHLSGSKMTVKYADGKKKASLNDNYQLGQIFTIKIESADGSVKVWYDGALKADLPISSETSYFKAGNYLQTNISKGDAASAVSQVVIYDLTIRHEQ